MSEFTIKRVASVAGVPITVRILRQGEHYGRDHMLTHDEPEPQVEFYSSQRSGDLGLGFFIGRYRYSTLAGTDGEIMGLRAKGCGLILYGGARNLDLSGEAMDEVMAWLLDELGRPPVTLRVVDDLPF